MRLCQGPLLAQKAFSVKVLPYLVILYLYAVLCLFSVLWSPPFRPPHSDTHSPLAVLAKCLGDNGNFSLGAAESLVTITVVGAKLCLPQWVLSSSDHKHEDQNQGALLASHYIQLRGFPQKPVVCLVILSGPFFQVLTQSPLQSMQFSVHCFLWHGVPQIDSPPSEAPLHLLCILPLLPTFEGSFWK